MRKHRISLPSITSKRIKYLGIYQPKEAKDLYTVKYKILIKEIKTTETDAEIWCSWIGRFIAIPLKLQMSFFSQNQQNCYNLYGNTKDHE